MCALSVEWLCPFLIPHQAGGDCYYSAAWDMRGCLAALQIKGRACSVGLCLLPAYWSDEILLVLRLQFKGSEQLRDGSAAGFSLCATAMFRWVVRASHASRNVRERVLPAPKTPATARVDLPDRNAKARLEAREAMR